MELCDMNLHAYIHKPTPDFMIHLYLPETNDVRGNVACKILADIALGLEFIHSVCEVHRDIKPKNGTTPPVSFLILVLYSRNDVVWKIADFGVTSEGTSRRARTTDNSRGTGGYRAPELCQELSTYTNKVDIWALGCITYELLTRKRLFREDWNVMRYVDQGAKPPIELQPISAIPNAPMACLTFIAQSSIQIDPLERPSASAILQLLSCYQEGIVEMVPAQQTSRRFISYLLEDIVWAKVRWLAYWYV